jgi:hypothetical protein
MNLVLLHNKILYLYEYTNGANVFCCLSVVFTPSTKAVLGNGSCLSSLYS